MPAKKNNKKKTNANVSAALPSVPNLGANTDRRCPAVRFVSEKIPAASPPLFLSNMCRRTIGAARAIAPDEFPD
jgi:hypothetical protein